MIILKNLKNVIIFIECFVDVLQFYLQKKEVNLLIFIFLDHVQYRK